MTIINKLVAIYDHPNWLSTSTDIMKVHWNNFMNYFESEHELGRVLGQWMKTYMVVAS
jgi:hypothetical protein